MKLLKKSTMSNWWLSSKNRWSKQMKPWTTVGHSEKMRKSNSFQILMMELEAGSFKEHLLPTTYHSRKDSRTACRPWLKSSYHHDFQTVRKVTITRAYKRRRCKWISSTTKPWRIGRLTIPRFTVKFMAIFIRGFACCIPIGLLLLQITGLKSRSRISTSLIRPQLVPKAKSKHPFTWRCPLIIKLFASSLSLCQRTGNFSYVW